MLRMIVLVMLASAATSFADEAREPEYLAPSEPPVLVPWKIGQFAVYRMTTREGTAMVTVRIVAQDGCGVWIEVEHERGEERRSVRTCVVRTPKGSLAIEQNRVGLVRRDGDLTDINHDADPLRDRVLARLLRAEWAGRKGLPREEVTTEGGRTILTLKETAVDGNKARTRWSHPDVPLGGLVREIEGDEELVLVDQGTRDTSVILEDNRRLLSKSNTLRVMYRPRKKWMTFSIGTDYVGTLDDASVAESLGFSLGYRFTPRLSIAINSTQTGYVAYAPVPELSERLVQATVGVRWHPYVGSRSRWALITDGIYTQLDAGYAQLDRRRLVMSSSVVGRGGVAGVRLGLSTGVSTDWRLAIEVHAHSALLNADEGTRVAVGLHGVIELYLP